MNSPVTSKSVDLSKAENRTRFIEKILSREADRSQREYSCADYTLSIIRLAQAFSDIIGDRRGAYRDQAEQSAITQRLSDAGWGFLYGAKSATPDNRMLQAWIAAVVEGINHNFR